jgi:hypothetical protein
MGHGCAYRGVFTFIHMDKRNWGENACSRFKKRFRADFQNLSLVTFLGFRLAIGSRVLVPREGKRDPVVHETGFAEGD